MCLTEPHAGSDLGMLKTKAVPDAEAVEDGTYKISGSKIFISSGEHDFADNIIHIVLARLPDAPRGIKGISLFLVPKFNVNTDGKPWRPKRAFDVARSKKKWASTVTQTCVMNFDDAQGYLISAPNKGMSAMFYLYQ